MEELFAPPAYEWKRLSEKYRSMQTLTNLIVTPILFTIPAVIVGVVWAVGGVVAWIFRVLVMGGASTWTNGV